jgi:hypothetical protein
MAMFRCGGGGKLKRTLVGSVTALQDTYTFDCTSIKGYNNLTVENFGLFPTRFYSKWTNSAGEGERWTDSSMTYDASTGILTIKGTGSNWPKNRFLLYDVYCFHC